MLSVFKLNLGIDFSSGTRVEVLSNEALTEVEVGEQLEKVGYPTTDIVISGDTNNIGVVRYKDEFKQEEVNQLKADLAAVYGADPNISTVSSTVGKELAQNAVLCTSCLQDSEFSSMWHFVLNGAWGLQRLSGLSMMYSSCWQSLVFYDWKWILHLLPPF